MKLAIGTGIGGNRQPDIAVIQQAEALGYDSVWAGETWGTDALSPLAFIAALTKKIKLGTSIVHIDGRTPAMTAMTAQTIDAMAGGGRMLLGIGTSGPQVVEGWHGQPWGKPNYRLRDNVAIMRKPAPSRRPRTGTPCPNEIRTSFRPRPKSRSVTLCASKPSVRCV